MKINFDTDVSFLYARYKSGSQSDSLYIHSIVDKKFLPVFSPCGFLLSELTQYLRNAIYGELYGVYLVIQILRVN